MKSGIMNLPMILGLVFASLVAGGIITAIGYYTPFMIASSVLMGIGAGLMTTFKIDTGHSKWIGYQALFGIGCGLGMQQPMMAVQTVLDIADVPTGTAVLLFCQTIGGSLFISIAQNVFTNKLLSGLEQYVPGLNPAIVLSAGATNLQADIASKYYQGVLLAYNSALVDAYYVSVAMASLTIIGAAAMEWKSVKGKQIGMGAA